MDGRSFAFYDLAPGEESFRDAVLAGLSTTPKSLPCKFFYDARGSALFEAICGAPEYYLTRTELAILEQNVGVIAAHIGRNARLIELGGGALREARILLAALEAPLAYVPVDISRGFLREAAAGIAVDFPDLEVVAVCADYTRPFELPKIMGPAGKTVGFFPGSMVSNFEPEAVVAFLTHVRKLLGPGAEMLIGVDVKKDKAVLDAAYNDAEGLNAAFNLNLLHRIAKELDSDIAIDDFDHIAFYNSDEGRVELYIRSLRDQTAVIAGRRFSFAAGEMIHTENSYKYSAREFQALATRAGFHVVDSWTDRSQLFRVYYFRQEAAAISELWLPPNLEVLRPEDIFENPEDLNRVRESLDLAEAAHLVRSMRRLAVRSDGRVGITQAELAARIEVSQSRISQIESGEGRDGPSFTLLKRISRACGIDWPGALPIDVETRQPTEHEQETREDD